MVYVPSLLSLSLSLSLPALFTELPILESRPLIHLLVWGSVVQLVDGPGLFPLFAPLARSFRATRRRRTMESPEIWGAC